MAETVARDVVVRTSTTSSGRSGCHSADLAVSGGFEPGELPVKPGGAISSFQTGRQLWLLKVSEARGKADMMEEAPSSSRPSDTEPTRRLPLS